MATTTPKGGIDTGSVSSLTCRSRVKPSRVQAKRSIGPIPNSSDQPHHPLTIFLHHFLGLYPQQNSCWTSLVHYLNTFALSPSLFLFCERHPSLFRRFPDDTFCDSSSSCSGGCRCPCGCVAEEGVRVRVGREQGLGLGMMMCRWLRGCGVVWC
jgi:hypothetical protein